MRRPRLLCALVLVLAGVPVASHAQGLAVGAGTSVDLGSATVDLGCADLFVNGLLLAGTSTHTQISNVTIGGSGTLNLESGALVVTRTWDNALGGSFVSGSGTVTLTSGCGWTTTEVYGSSSFFDLVLTAPAEGRDFRLASGTTQTVTGQLTITGSGGAQPLVLRSTLGGSEAFLDAQGGMTIDHADVQDLHGGAQALVFGPNSAIGTNVASLELCGDLDGNLALEGADVGMAREHLVGNAVGGDVTLCNVVGPHDGSGTGADCNVDDIFVLERFVLGEPVSATNGCVP